MKPDEFWNSTLREVFRFITYGNLEEWRRTRFIAWQVYLSYEKDKDHKTLSLLEYYPLPGDPTAKELERTKRISDKKEEKKLRKIMEDTLKKYGL